MDGGERRPGQEPASEAPAGALRKRAQPGKAGKAGGAGKVIRARDMTNLSDRGGCG